jgi:sec-independent protein translocase protein TatB
MFDFAWSEIALIALVALIAIGPKDMPVAMRAVTGMIKKARRMAAEFQGHVDEMRRYATRSTKSATSTSRARSNATSTRTAR